MYSSFLSFILIFFTSFLIFVAFGSDVDCGADPSLDSGTLWYATTSTIVNIPSLSDVDPPVETPPGVAMYLSASSCLGYLGPIGPYGPLGSLGPLGLNTWNPQYWISDSFSWSEWSEMVTGMGGPLSYDGPLGGEGPFTQTSVYETLPCVDDYSHQLISGGLWEVLGPLGALGTVGPLGPLGPIGAHGYVSDSVGRWMNDFGEVQRTYSVPYDSTGTYNRTFELYEDYTQDFACLTGGAKKENQDTSFMVKAFWNSSSPSSNKYPFISQEDQLVTVLVVPVYQLDSFSLTLTDKLSKVIASTSESLFINWIQVRVKAGETLIAVVDLNFSEQIFSKEYILYVTGSTNEFELTDITGPHLVSR